MLRLCFTASVFSLFVLVACSSSTESAQPSGSKGSTEPEPSSSTGGGKDGGASSVPVKGATCNASKSCSGGAECVTGGGDEGFCALACDPKVGCANGLRCAEVASGGGAFCLESCADDDDCASGFTCTRSVGAVLGKYACVRSCEGIADYCGEGVACGKSGLCPARLVCDDAKTASSGVASDRTLGSLQTSDRIRVCEFIACGWGSYGASKKCDGGLTMSAPEDEAECLGEKMWAQCKNVTVGELEACEKKMRVDQCKMLEVLTTDPDCASLLACVE